MMKGGGPRKWESQEIRSPSILTASRSLYKVLEQPVECNDHCMATFGSGAFMSVSASNPEVNVFKSAALKNIRKRLGIIQLSALHVSPSVEDCNALFKCTDTREWLSQDSFEAFRAAVVFNPLQPSTWLYDILGCQYSSWVKCSLLRRNVKFDTAFSQSPAFMARQRALA